MKIDGHNLIKNLEGHLSNQVEPHTDSINYKKEVNWTYTGDTVEISDRFVEFNRIKSTIKAIPEIREEKVRGLIEEIRNGRYEIIAELLAPKLIREHILDALNYRN